MTVIPYMKRFTLLLPLLLLSVIALAQETKPFNGKEHYKKRTALFNSQPIPAKGHIVMLGDSHVEFGNEWGELIQSDKVIINRGIIGDTSTGMKKRALHACKGKPSDLFIECGANDLASGISSKEVADGIISLISTLRKISPGTTLHVNSVLPINESFGRWKTLKGKTDTIPVINLILQRYCADNGIDYVDIFSKLVEPGTNTMRLEYCKDGLHLLPKGYEVWATELKQRECFAR
ncbi:MAG: GDSL-type esterase/lipase family protein [Prevotella sp.]|nr:GDSL-type esterase/lipase family protein [Prevotella sp.]MDD6392774.1 GDSL-type esterase/lipase family protein [Prevotella sp.]MDY2703026.1 GDSL-type esterase/lipase family protein [Prevotella sp.]